MEIVVGVGGRHKIKLLNHQLMHVCLWAKTKRILDLTDPSFSVHWGGGYLPILFGLVKWESKFYSLFLLITLCADLGSTGLGACTRPEKGYPGTIKVNTSSTSFVYNMNSNRFIMCPGIYRPLLAILRLCFEPRDAQQYFVLQNFEYSNKNVILGCSGDLD